MDADGSDSRDSRDGSDSVEDFNSWWARQAFDGDEGSPDIAEQDRLESAEKEAAVRKVARSFAKGSAPVGGQDLMEYVVMLDWARQSTLPKKVDKLLVATLRTILAMVADRRDMQLLAKMCRFMERDAWPKQPRTVCIKQTFEELGLTGTPRMEDLVNDDDDEVYLDVPVVYNDYDMYDEPFFPLAAFAAEAA